MVKNFLAKYWQLILILLLGISVAWPLFVPGYFSHHDDLQIMRLFEMKKCLTDAQIPCRWVPDMGYGNGFPLFNYYGPLPYYLGGLISFLLSYITSAKVLFFVALIAGGIGMYSLVKELWGSMAGVAAATLYLLAPYKALDIYVRGALSEAFSLTLIPFVFLFGYKLIKSRQVKDFVLFTLFFAAFLTTHNIMTIIFAPVVIIWLGYWLFLGKGKGLKQTLLALVLGAGLSAFFTLPAFFEKPLIQAEALTRFELDFRANFVSVKQLFLDRFWGYGVSTLGAQDTISFQVGWPHWWLVIAGLTASLWGKKGKEKLLVLGLAVLFVGSVFMMHNKSTFIWERIALLQYFQFPWRFLSLSIFTSSILGGYFVYRVGKQGLWVASGIVILTLLLNWGYFKPYQFYSGLTDTEKLSGTLWETQQKGAILDYLPMTALEPREKAPDTAQTAKGSAEVSNFENHSNRWRFSTQAQTKSYIEVPVFYFPGWKATIDGEETNINHENYLGRIGIIVEAGNHVVEGKFTDTPTRRFSNYLTLISILGLLFLVFYGKTRKIFN